MKHEFRMLATIGIDYRPRHRVKHDQPRPTVLHEFTRHNKYRHLELWHRLFPSPPQTAYFLLPASSVHIEQRHVRQSFGQQPE